MTGDDFQAGMRELTDVYGAKWPKPLMDRIWAQVRDIDGQAFKSIMHGIAFNSMKPPMAGEIVSACSSLIRTAKEKRKVAAIEKMNREGRCKVCENSGWVFCEIPGKAPEYGFRCNACQAAQIQQISGSVPYWNQERHPKMRIRDYSPGADHQLTKSGVRSELNAVLEHLNDPASLEPQIPF